jgi:hypothetical protein
MVVIAAAAPTGTFIQTFIHTNTAAASKQVVAAGSRQQAAGSRQQAAGSRQQAAGRCHKSLSNY